jgi:hypothetical protein
MLTFFYLLLFIFLKKDIETNLASSNDRTIYTSDHTDTWERKGLVCETCDQWFHINCEGVNSKSHLELCDIYNGQLVLHFML